MKWIWVCLAVDLEQDTFDVAINGDLNATYWRDPDSRTMTDKMTGNDSLPMTIRLGHFYFDNKPIIGKIVDFHMWNR